VHLPSFLDEIDSLEALGVEVVEGRILFRDRSHLIFNFHQEVDGVIKNRLGRNNIGTTKKGISPAYASKISSNDIRAGDLRDLNYFEMQF
jgi:adenylosuccinate synthase